MPKAKSKTPKAGASTKTKSQKLATIRSRSRRGDISIISKLTGYEYSHVNRVLKGERNNPSGEIIEAAYSLVSKRK